MKRIGNLFDQIISIDNIRAADKQARKGKLKSYGVIKHIEDEEDNIYNLHMMLKNGEYKTSPYTVFKIYEPKEREIYRLPYYPDRILHHSVQRVIEPILLLKTFTADTYSSIKGRGLHKASYRLRNYLKDTKGTKYCLKLDIKKFYPSVCNETLKLIIRRKIKDKRLLSLLDEIIDSSQGLPVGNLLSQLFGNLYLTSLDHYIKENLAVKYYSRYCDDMVILSDSKEQLHKWFEKIQIYLKDNLKLQVKSNYQIFPVVGRGIDYLGYKHYHTHTLLRKSIKKRYIKTTRPTSLAAYNGWLKHCNAINLRNKYNK